MKRFSVVLCIVVLAVLAGCTWVVQDTRTPEERAAQATAKAEKTAAAILSSTVPPVTIEPAVVPSEEVGLLEPEPTPAPPCDVVKGNISKDGRKLYHVAGMANYNQVKIDESAGERFFCSAAEAEAAGWVRAGN